MLVLELFNRLKHAHFRISKPTSLYADLTCQPLSIRAVSDKHDLLVALNHLRQNKAFFFVRLDCLNHFDEVVSSFVNFYSSFCQHYDALLRWSASINFFHLHRLESLLHTDVDHRLFKSLHYLLGHITQSVFSDHAESCVLV